MRDQLKDSRWAASTNGISGSLTIVRGSCLREEHNLFISPLCMKSPKSDRSVHTLGRTPRYPASESGYVWVLDPGLLGRLLRETAKQKKLDHAKAANAIGIDRSHFNRLSRGEVKPRITRETFDGIRRFLPVDRWSELEQVVLAPKAKEALQYYAEWLSDGLERFNMAGAVWAVDVFWHPSRAARKPSISKPRFMSRRRLMAGGLYAECEAMLSRLSGHEVLSRHLQAFRKWASERGYDVHGPRVLLAQLRAVEPLATLRARGVERGWDDLSERELDGFLKASFKREQILLDRPADLTSAQAAPLVLDARIRKAARDRPSADLGRLLRYYDRLNQTPGRPGKRAERTSRRGSKKS